MIEFGNHEIKEGTHTWRTARVRAREQIDLREKSWDRTRHAHELRLPRSKGHGQRSKPGAGLQVIIAPAIMLSSPNRFATTPA
jgi:hypothetical protein